MVIEDLDFDVWQALQARRTSEADSLSDVIRRALELPAASVGDRPWKGAHATFDHGTKFRATYKGTEYFAEVVDGAIIYNGEKFSSMNAATKKVINGGHRNAWDFWEYQRPDGTWRNLKK